MNTDLCLFETSVLIRENPCPILFCHFPGAVLDKCVDTNKNKALT